MSRCSRGDGTPHLVLLGTGTVGQAVVQRHALLRERGLPLPPLTLLANARGVQRCGVDAQVALWESRLLPPRTTAPPGHLLAERTLRAGDLVIDASADDAVADCHPRWLEAGVHVICANKLGAGGPLQRQQRIARAVAQGLAHYGDAATVGAGLPVLRSLRALQAGGDRILSLQALLSGSLAWLLSPQAAGEPFSERVRQARLAGITEPDPRIDLSGEDVRRKLLILVRSLGVALEQAQVQVRSLVPAALAACPLDGLDAALWQLDAPLAAARQAAPGRTLAMVARWSGSQAQVALEALPHGHPLLGGQGSDNRVLIRSERYDAQPLCIQGPGAGAAITAAALLDDVVQVCSRTGWQSRTRLAG